MSVCACACAYVYVTFFFLLTLMNERAKCADFFANHFQTVYFLAKLELQDLKKIRLYMSFYDSSSLFVAGLGQKINLEQNNPNPNMNECGIFEKQFDSEIAAKVVIFSLLFPGKVLAVRAPLNCDRFVFCCR